ncbi:hypothetical protein CL654_02070 [bacterium]|nr:hypothetical protein [bacterium]
MTPNDATPSKDTIQKKLWFKRKLFGWGWYPSSWEGWLVTFLYIGVMGMLGYSAEYVSDDEFMLRVFLPLIVLTLLFIRIAYATGEKPRWQWGKRLEDNE